MIFHAELWSASEFLKKMKHIYVIVVIMTSFIHSEDNVPWVLKINILK